MEAEGQGMNDRFDSPPTLLVPGPSLAGLGGLGPKAEYGGLRRKKRELVHSLVVYCIIRK